MRLYLYYAFHTTINQVKKVLKTWIFLIVLASLLTGGLFGLNIGRTANFLKWGFARSEIIENAMEYFKFNLVGKNAIIELVVSFVMLLIMSMHVITSEKTAAQLFLPADVNFLFTSDRSKQQNLMFRIMSTIGTAAVATVYMAFQMPNLVKSLMLDPFCGIVLFLFWCFALLFSIILKIVIYEVTCNNVKIRYNARFFLFIVLGCIDLSFYFYYRMNEDLPIVMAMDNFFNASWVYYVPVYGWMKAMLRNALDGNTMKSLLYTLLNLVTLIGLYAFLKKYPADYYEDATVKSEEIALYMAESGPISVLTPAIRRPKTYSKELDRDVLHKGEGANVFFYKSLANRERFSSFGWISKTTVSYSLVISFISLLAKELIELESVEGMVITFTGFIFFHSIINSSSNDRKYNAFKMIPEPTWKKLFWSYSGELLSSFIDCIIPLVCISLLIKGNPFTALKFVPFLVAINFFTISLNSFIEEAMPESVDITFKQCIQIILLYLAILPDILLLSWGAFIVRSNIGFIVAGLFNLVLGLLFMSLTCVLLVPVAGNVPVLEKEDCPSAKKTFSRIGFAVMAMLGITFVWQFIFSKLSQADLIGQGDMSSIVYFLPIYLLAFPSALLIAPKAVNKGLRRIVSVKLLCLALPVCFFVMYSSNIIGLFLGNLKNEYLPVLFDSGLTYTSFDTVVYSVCAVLIAPLFEELLFRKTIIDAVKPYGESLAVGLSALLFGLAHGNFNQFFYAFTLGVVLGFIYLRTNNWHNTFIIHVLINFMGSVIAPFFLNQLLSSMGENAIAGAYFNPLANRMFGVFVLYILCLLILSLIGLVIFAYFAKKERFSANRIKMKNVFVNSGMITFTVFSLILILFSA